MLYDYKPNIGMYIKQQRNVYKIKGAQQFSNAPWLNKYFNTHRTNIE